MSLLENVIGYGATGSKPAAAAANEGYLWYDTTLRRLERSDGSAWFVISPGAELDYAEITSPVTVTATSEGAADTVVTGTSQAYVATPVIATFYTPFLQSGNFTTFCIVYLYDVATSTVIGRLNRTDVINGDGSSVLAEYRFTPTAATHQYRVRAYIDAGTQANINAGSGGSAAYLPAFLRITKA
jgi:hypothetical protein